MKPVQNDGTFYSSNDRTATNNISSRTSANLLLSQGSAPSASALNLVPTPPSSSLGASPTPSQLSGRHVETSTNPPHRDPGGLPGRLSKVVRPKPAGNDISFFSSIFSFDGGLATPPWEMSEEQLLLVRRPWTQLSEQVREAVRGAALLAQIKGGNEIGKKKWWEKAPWDGNFKPTCLCSL